MTLHIVTDRFKFLPTRTNGALLLNGYRVGYTLEDPVREIPGRPVSEWKVQDDTAIGVGSYRLILEDSAAFGPDTMTLIGVDGYTHIRAHAGNSEVDTKGCQVLG